ncbi:MAG TPA: hypothetical protein VH592_08860 [Gemmataceae bacterium]|jgi:hypothetical protein
MVCRISSFAQGIALLLGMLLTASAAKAQTSAAGHVPARGVAAPNSLQGLPPFGIHPGDRMFQATMKIQSTYQAAERAAPVTVYRRPAPRVVQEEAAPVEVTVTGPEGPTEMVSIRGPNGEVRSFPLVGGRQAIKARTIIVRPGQTLNLTVRGSSVTITTKR